MQKQNIFSALSFIGFIFIIALTFGYFYTKKERVILLQEQISVPKGFADQFSRIIVKKISQSMPNTSFLSPDGDEITWDDFKGQYLLVNFWATWCAPCVIELPSLNKLKSRFDDNGLKTVAISLDKQRNHDQVKRFAYNRNIDDFVTYYDHNNEVQRKVRMRGIPTTYLLNPDGKILYIFEGDAQWDSPQAIKFFSTLLKQ